MEERHERRRSIELANRLVLITRLDHLELTVSDFKQSKEAIQSPHLVSQIFAVEKGSIVDQEVGL